MPCLLTSCNLATEAARFVACVIGIYVYQYVSDTFLIKPWLRSKYISSSINPSKSDQFRESAWKNVAVATYFSWGLYISAGESWFFNPFEYFDNFGDATALGGEGRIIDWYYMAYMAFWLQSIDFLLSNRVYKIKRKDSFEMLMHHLVTLLLMAFSFLFEFQKIGICICILHDVSDLFLETAKIFVYLKAKVLSDIFFGLFALTWYILRWGLFSSNILHSVAFIAYEKFVTSGDFGPQWFYMWLFFLVLLSILQILHVFWGYLIGKMVIKALVAGEVEKDIRSDDEEDDDEDQKNK